MRKIIKCLPRVEFNHNYQKKKYDDKTISRQIKIDEVHKS